MSFISVLMYSLLIVVHCFSKNDPFYVLINLAKSEQILIIFCVRNLEKISHKSIVNLLTSPEQCHHTTLWNAKVTLFAVYNS